MLLCSALDRQKHWTAFHMYCTHSKAVQKFGLATVRSQRYRIVGRRIECDFRSTRSCYSNHNSSSSSIGSKRATRVRVRLVTVRLFAFSSSVLLVFGRHVRVFVGTDWWIPSSFVRSFYRSVLFGHWQTILSTTWRRVWFHAMHGTTADKHWQINPLYCYTVRHITALRDPYLIHTLSVWQLKPRLQFEGHNVQVQGHRYKKSCACSVFTL